MSQSSVTLSRAMASTGWLIVVIEGMKKRAICVPSKPVTETSCGTRSPRSASARMTPAAMVSLMVSTAVTPRCASK